MIKNISLFFYGTQRKTFYPNVYSAETATKCVALWRCGVHVRDRRIADSLRVAKKNDSFIPSNDRNTQDDWHIKIHNNARGGKERKGRL